MKNQLKSINLLLFAVIAPNLACANSWYGAPTEVVFSVLSAIIILGVGLNILISRLIKFIFEKKRNEKRTHLWIQITAGFLLTTLFIITQENWDWLKQKLMSICNDEYFPNIFTIGSFAIVFLIIGSLIGYFLTPIKDSGKNEKPNKTV